MFTMPDDELKSRMKEILLEARKSRGSFGNQEVVDALIDDLAIEEDLCNLSAVVFRLFPEVVRELGFRCTPVFAYFAENGRPEKTGYTCWFDKE